MSKIMRGHSHLFLRAEPRVLTHIGCFLAAYLTRMNDWYLSQYACILQAVLFSLRDCRALVHDSTSEYEW